MVQFYFLKTEMLKIWNALEIRILGWSGNQMVQSCLFVLFFCLVKVSNMNTLVDS